MIIIKNFAKIQSGAKELAEQFNLEIPSNFSLHIDPMTDSNSAGIYDHETNQITLILKNHVVPHDFLNTYVHMISHHYTKEESHSKLYKEFTSELSNRL